MNFDNYTGLVAGSNGGTEQMYRRLESTMHPQDKIDFQIICSRITDFDSTKKFVVYWAHDLAGDPAASKLHDANIIRKIDAFVFVSNWQREQFLDTYQIPYIKTHVIRNAIEFTDTLGWGNGPDVDDPEIHLVYHTTPHRGLELLVKAFQYFNRPKQDGPTIKLHVFSSYEVYGNKAADNQFQKLFKDIESNPYIINYGYQPNSKIREFLMTKADIFAYPCIWPETSSLALIEAMSSGVTCVIPKGIGAIEETASLYTTQNKVLYTPETPRFHSLNMLEVLHNKVLPDIKHLRRYRQRSLELGNGQNRHYDWMKRRKLEWDILFKNIRNSH